MTCYQDDGCERAPVNQGYCGRHYQTLRRWQRQWALLNRERRLWCPAHGWIAIPEGKELP